MRSELDWIVLKALEKDRSRRYETASGFAADVQRYLAGEPVQAHPPTLRYRLRKFYRRNRGPLVAAALVVAALAAGLVATSVGFERASRERDRAEAAERNAVENALRALDAADAERREKERAVRSETAAREQERQAKRNAAEAQALIQFIDTLVWEGDTQISEKSHQRDRSFYEALAAAEPQIGEQLRDHPLAEAQLRALLGDLYGNRSDERAIPQYKRSLELRRRELGPDHELTFAVMGALADVFVDHEQWEAALAMQRECMTHRMRTHGPTHPSTLHHRIWFAKLCFEAGHPDQGRAAVDAVERDLGVLKARGGLLELDVVKRFKDLGDVYKQHEETDKALRWFHEAGRAFGADAERFTQDVEGAAGFIKSLADAYLDAGQLENALQWYERYVNALNAGWKRADGSPLLPWFEMGGIDRTNRPEDLERIAAILSSHAAFVRRTWPNDRNRWRNRSRSWAGAG